MVERSPEEAGVASSILAPGTLDTVISFMHQFEQAFLRDNYTEAEEALWNLFEQGMLPVVTVQKKYLNFLKKGLRKSSSWIGENIIAGTIGRDPYLPSGEERVLVKIKVSSPEQLEPRLTGEDRKFHGVVAFRGPIEPEQLEIVQ